MRKLFFMVMVMGMLALGSNAFGNDVFSISTIWDEWHESKWHNSTTYEGYTIKLKYVTQLPERMAGKITRVQMQNTISCKIKASTKGGYEKYTDTEETVDTFWLYIDPDGYGKTSRTKSVMFPRERKFQIYECECGYNNEAIAYEDINGVIHKK